MPAFNGYYPFLIQGRSLTIQQALAVRLGREPTRAELVAEVARLCTLAVNSTQNSHETISAKIV